MPQDPPGGAGECPWGEVGLLSGASWTKTNISLFSVMQNCSPSEYQQLKKKSVFAALHVFRCLYYYQLQGRRQTRRITTASFMPDCSFKAQTWRKKSQRHNWHSKKKERSLSIGWSKEGKWGSRRLQSRLTPLVRENFCELKCDILKSTRFSCWRASEKSGRQAAPVTSLIPIRTVCGSEPEPVFLGWMKVGQNHRSPLWAAAQWQVAENSQTQRRD